jgi:NAD(P)-dependent dehydrogenase (short-subunit alcohol dehydrogenase family)
MGSKEKQGLDPGIAAAVVVTGVSTGIGNATLHELVRAGWHVFGSVRKQEDADRLSRELGASYTPLIFDVTDAAALASAAEQVRNALGARKLCGLVNNVGVAVPGPLLELPVSEFRRQIEVNLVGALAVTQAFFPLLRKAHEEGGRPGRIVMMSSVAGRIAVPFLGPYAASKYGVEGLSDSLRRECMLYGVDVVVIEPAVVATPIWDKAETLDLSVYANSPYREQMQRVKDTSVAAGRRGSPPEAVGRLVARVLAARKPRARYMVGRGSAGIWLATHFVRTRLVDQVIGRAIGLRPRSPANK